MANEDNLIPTNRRSKEEARELGRKGGIKSGERRREKRAMRELLAIALEKKCIRGDITNKEESAAQLAKKMAEGDLKAIEVGLKLLGEYEQKVKLEGDMRSVQVVVNDEDTAAKLTKILNKE